MQYSTYLCARYASPDCSSASPVINQVGLGVVGDLGDYVCQPGFEIGLGDGSVWISGNEKPLKSEVDIENVYGILDLIDGFYDLDGLLRDGDAVLDEKVNNAINSRSINTVVDGLGLENGIEAEQVENEGVGSLLEDLVPCWLIWV